MCPHTLFYFGIKTNISLISYNFFFAWLSQSNINSRILFAYTRYRGSTVWIQPVNLSNLIIQHLEQEVTLFVFSYSLKLKR